jgi:predicted amidohydrolase
VDPKNPEPGKKENVEHMCWLIDQAQGYGVIKNLMKDLIILHESPIQGWNALFSRDEQYAISIDVDGWELETLGKKAKEYDCFIMLGSYARHQGWPKHYVNTGFVIDTKGKVILKNWKKRNMPGSAFNTPVYDVLDKFVEMYGWDEIFPVARTEVGNLCVIPEIFDPEIVRAFAIRGAEIFLRYMTNGLSFRFDVPTQCRTNQMYGIFINQAVYDCDVRLEDSEAGGSAIFDNWGKILAEATSHHETLVSANIPLAEYRKTHSIPIVRKGLFKKIWEDYECKIPPNTYLKSLPQNKVDQIERLKKEYRW